MYKNIIKRIIDLLLSIIALPFFLLLYIIIGTLIKLEDGGKVIYKAKRIGKDSKIFNMYKFRSMKENAPNILNEDGSTYNSENDTRVTKVGKIIRKTSLDETPQVINVLLGQMSIIGPRASGAEALKTYKKDEKDKMKVRPGITGYCQAYYRNSISVREKRLKDAWYANNVSFWLDVKIFFKTIVTVLKHENIYTNYKGEESCKNYLYISNGTKGADYYSKEDITLNNMRKCCIEPAISMGYKVYMTQNRKYANQIRVKHYDIEMYDANIYRSIFNIKDNYRAYKQLNHFLDTHNIDVIHCNSPIGGVLGRICGSKHHVKKIIYTAHGFHFYKGNNRIKNWIFKIIERTLAKKTDAIIAINEEDYEAAKKFKLKKGGKVFHINGVGINLHDIQKTKTNRNKKRNELGIPKDAILIISTGDLIKRKHYDQALSIISQLKNEKIMYLICGSGPQLDRLETITAKLGIKKKVIFMGHRTDVLELLQISDLFLFTTKQEGLPRSLMEAAAVGLPCVASNTRGNIDLCKDIKNIYICNNELDYINKIQEILNTAHSSKNIRPQILSNMNKYDIASVVDSMKKIYKEVGL